MTVIRERSIPCTDCADWKQDLELKGFRVLDCLADGQHSGFCTIRFDEAEGLSGAAQSDELIPEIGMTVFAPETGENDLVARSSQLTPTQRKTALAIVNLFETSEVLGKYGEVTLIAGDSGHLTYGRSQTTLGSGNLGQLLQRYCANQGARFATRLEPFLPNFTALDFALDTDLKLHNILRACADDPVMRDTQDAFFDEVYWLPAFRAAESLGVTLPLGVAVVYDSHVHGSWMKMRDQTSNESGMLTALGEKVWIRAYVTRRRNWLASHPRADIRATVYRMDAFQRLIDQNRWGLELPLVVRDKEISNITLNAAPPGCYDGPQPGTRALAVQAPLQRGLDVRLVQLGISDGGSDIKADGIFGQTTAKLIANYQLAQGLSVTGVCDVALIARLVA